MALSFEEEDFSAPLDKETLNKMLKGTKQDGINISDNPSGINLFKDKPPVKIPSSEDSQEGVSVRVLSPAEAKMMKLRNSEPSPHFKKIINNQLIVRLLILKV